MVRSLAEARACARTPPYDFFGSWSGVIQYLLSSLTTSPYSVIVMATSAQTRDMRGPTPLYSASTPSFLMSSDRQCSEERYLG